MIVRALAWARRATCSTASSPFPRRGPSRATIPRRRHRGALLATAALLLMETASARLTRRSGTSFYYAFRILPEAKRRAIFALYSFCRVVDDCVDEEGAGEKPGSSAGWRKWSAAIARYADDATWAGTSPGPWRASRSRAAASRRSSQAAAWT